MRAAPSEGGSQWVRSDEWCSFEQGLKRKDDDLTDLICSLKVEKVDLSRQGCQS